MADKTGRFSERPYYPQRELDEIFESRIETFLNKRCGRVRYPISTDDLTRLIEESADDLDLYAEIEEPDIEGITLFRVGERPSVKISRRLASDQIRENRLRSTLAHEFAHVLLHAQLYANAADGRSPNSAVSAFSQACKVANPGSNADWMEWQAGYGSGALLIPCGAMFRVVTQFQRELRLEPCPIVADNIASNMLIERIAAVFQTSTDAARRRAFEEGVIINPIPPLEALARLPRRRSPGLVPCSEILPYIAAPLGIRWYPSPGEPRASVEQQSTAPKTVKSSAELDETKFGRTATRAS